MLYNPRKINVSLVPNANGIQEVEGSTPFGSTRVSAYLAHFLSRDFVAGGCSDGCWAIPIRQ
jgi:hypothetical protein